MEDCIKVIPDPEVIYSPYLQEQIPHLRRPIPSILLPKIKSYEKLLEIV